jgi:hypothetical protein
LAAVAALLKERDIYSVFFQLLEMDDPTGRLTTDENRVLFAELAFSPQIQYKLTQTTKASSLSHLDKT